MREAFIQHIFSQFGQHCLEKKISGNSANFLDFMLSSRMITEVTIRHYVLLQEYKMLEGQGLGKNKTERVKLLAEKYEIHPNTVWNVLKDHRNKFLFENVKNKM